MANINTLSGRLYAHYFIIPYDTANLTNQHPSVTIIYGFNQEFNSCFNESYLVAHRLIMPVTGFFLKDS